MTKTAAKKNTKPATENKTRTRYNWTDELKKEIADKLATAKRGEREPILEAYSEQTGVNAASIYAVVNAFRNGGNAKSGRKNMSAVERLAALKAEQEQLQNEVVTELQDELAACIARQAEIEAELDSMEAPHVAETEAAA